MNKVMKLLSILAVMLLACGTISRPPISPTQTPTELKKNLVLWQILRVSNMFG